MQKAHKHAQGSQEKSPMSDEGSCIGFQNELIGKINSVPSACYVSAALYGMSSELYKRSPYSKWVLTIHVFLPAQNSPMNVANIYKT